MILILSNIKTKKTKIILQISADEVVFQERSLGLCLNAVNQQQLIKIRGGRCGRDRMLVGFTTTYAISTYHH